MPDFFTEIATSANTGVFILMSAIIGFFGGWLISIYTSWKDKRYLRKNVASAFYGEIRALLNTAKRRKYLGQLREMSYIIDNDMILNITPVPINHNLFKIYESNAEHIGSLPHPIPSRISRFYILVGILVEDAAILGCKEFKQLKKETQIRFVRESISNLRHCLKLGQKIKKALEKEIHDK